MKHFKAALAVTVFYLVGSNEGCAQPDKKESSVVKTKTDTMSTPQAVAVKGAASIKEIIVHYLQLKNALANDNPKDAATAGKEIVVAMGILDTTLFTVGQKKLYEDVADDAREHAEHIGANAGKIEHQRGHFDMLSKDVYELVKAFGNEQLLYKDFCPMYNKVGAMWLSETKAITNPYYGKTMLTCGSVQEELK